MTLRNILISGSLVAAMLPAGIILAPASSAATVSFTSSSATATSTHTWTVPAGVTKIRVTATGASGSGGVSVGGERGGSGAPGAVTTATLNVAPGDILGVGLGAAASGSTGGASGPSSYQPAGFYGSGGSGGATSRAPGGGGGGSTIVEVTRGSDNALAMVAAGGGGGGGAHSLTASVCTDSTAGSGGSARSLNPYGGPTPSPGVNGLPTTPSGIGGNGGGAGSGGSGGNGGGGAGSPNPFNLGYPGTLRNGGSAGVGTQPYAGGGGGGAGVYGGGGGAGPTSYVPDDCGSGGGGGGGFSGLFTGDSTTMAPLWTNANYVSSEADAGSQASVIIDYIVFTTSTIPAGTAGTSYSASISATFGSSTIPGEWAITPTLPTGLTLNPATGSISGTPVTASSGTYTITATSKDSITTTLTAKTSRDFSLSILPQPPTVTSVSPTSGPVAGGSVITIDGTNLANPTFVYFGTVSATITTQSATRVQAILPAGAGTVNVSVATAGGTSGSSAGSQFNYNPPVISGVSPSNGSANGGASVYVDGTDLLNVTSVTFGGQAGTITSVTDTRVTVLTPSISSTGAVTVVATATDGQSSSRPAAFTFSPALPGTPTSVSATAGVESATISWTPPILNGGLSLNYTVSANPGSSVCNTTATSCVISVLTAGTSYSFTVIAKNASGDSSASTVSNSVIPSAPGGGGGGGGDSQPDSPTIIPEVKPTFPDSLAPATENTPKPLPSVPEQKPQTIPGFKPPKNIKVPGRTILVLKALKTSDGKPVTARANIRLVNTLRNAPGPNAKRGAKITRYKNGRITVTTTGKKPVIVTLRLMAPKSASSPALNQLYSWRVPKSRTR